MKRTTLFVILVLGVLMVACTAPAAAPAPTSSPASAQSSVAPLGTTDYCGLFAGFGQSADACVEGCFCQRVWKQVPRLK